MAFPFGSVTSGDLPRRNRRRNRFAERLRRYFHAGAGATARRGTLLFDPLEPRLLMSADVLSVNLAQAAAAQQDHSLVVEMVTAVEQTGTTSQNVQRVEVVDQAQNNAVLAVGDLSVVSSVNIVGNAASANNDTVSIDTDSFGGLALPSVSFQGGGGANTLVVEHATGTETWQIDGAGSGQATGPAAVSFGNVQNLVGGAGVDTLAGPTADTIWNVTGAGSGNVAGFNFSGFENLQGAADNQATFVFSQGGTLAGGIDGGAKDLGALVVQGNYNTEVMSATGAHAGSVTLDGNTFQYAGLAPITMSGTTANAVFDLPDAGVNAVLTAGPAGSLTLSDPGLFESTTFADPTGSLTINLGAGVISGNTLTIQSLDSGFNAGLTVNSDTPSSIADAISGSFFIPESSNTVNVNTNVSTDGHDLSINANTVNIASNVTINTQSPTGNSGAITIAGSDPTGEGPHNITVGSGAVLNANAFNANFSAGAIKLETNDQNYRVIELPIAYSDKWSRSR